LHLEDNRILSLDLETSFLPEMLAMISREMARVARLYVTLVDRTERKAMIYYFQDLYAPILELLAINMDPFSSSDSESEDSETNLALSARGPAPLFHGGAPKLATLQYAGLGFLSAQVPLDAMTRIHIRNTVYGLVDGLRKLCEMVSSAPRLQTLELYGDDDSLAALRTRWDPSDPSYDWQVEAPHLGSLIVDNHTQVFLSVLNAPYLTRLKLHAVDLPNFVEFLSRKRESHFPCLTSLTLFYVDTPSSEVARTLMLGLPNIEYFAFLESILKRNCRLLRILADETHLWPNLNTVRLFGATKTDFTRLLQTRGSSSTLRTVVLSDGFVSRISAVRDVAQAFDVTISTFEWSGSRGINRYGRSWGFSRASGYWNPASSDEDE
jgi:hypothetical protein